MENQKTEKSVKQYNATFINFFIVFIKTMSVCCDVALNGSKIEQVVASVQCLISGPVLAFACRDSRNYQNPTETLNYVSPEHKP